MGSPEVEAQESTEIARTDHLPAKISREEISEMTMLALKSPDPAGAIKQLLEMRHLEEDRQAKREFDAALDKFHAECPQLQKTKTAEIVTKSGAKYTYKYIPLDVLDRALRPVARKHGLRWKWDGAEASGKMTKTCTLRHIGGHSESSSFTCTVDSKADISGPQKAGGASSYAKRQTLLDVFGLAAYENDNDCATGTLTKITLDEQTYIEDLIRETGAPLSNFLQCFEVERVEDLPATSYVPAKNLLERRKAAKS